MKRIKLLDILLLLLKIILPIFLLLPLVFFSWRLIEGRVEDIANIGNPDYHSGLGLYIFASHVVLLGVNAVLLVVGCIGLLISKKYTATPTQAKNISIFRLLSLAPVASQVIYLLINHIVVNVG